MLLFLCLSAFAVSSAVEEVFDFHADSNSDDLGHGLFDKIGDSLLWDNNNNNHGYDDDEINPLLLSTDPEMYMSTPEIVRHWGYPAEEHFPTTDDGYILGLHRIPGGFQSQGAGNASGSVGKPAVLLMHGMMASSANFVTNLPKQSLGFILADAGYDVWMANVRGNTYSKKHERLSTKSKEFWSFSWQEMAEHDLPAIVDYVLNKTGRDSLHYIGHSQGNLIMFTRASLDEDGSFSRKIASFTALGPVARVDHMTSPLRYVASVAGPMKWLFYLIGKHEFLAKSWVIDMWTKLTCQSSLKFICSNFLFLIADFDENNLNKTRIPVYFTHTPAGTSVQNMLHFAQEISSKKWQRFDLGKKENQRVYGQPTPPNFDAAKVKLPVYAFSGGRDSLASQTDVAWLLSQLPNLKQSWYDPAMDHLAMTWGLNAKDKIYKPILEYLKTFH